MNAETIHLFALLSLRALADYDPIEFRRATDLSSRELDRRLAEMMDRLPYGSDDDSVGELHRRLADLEAVRGEAESQVELTFHLRQLSRSTLEHAQRLALSFSRSEARSAGPIRDMERRAGRPEHIVEQREDDFVRLGVMRLLRDLPEYVPSFNYRVRDVEVDAILEPRGNEGPTIFVEAKRQLVNPKNARQTAQRLRKLTGGWGRDTQLVILSSYVPEEVKEILGEPRNNLHLLIYDPETNEFVWQSQQNLVTEVRERIERS